MLLLYVSKDIFRSQKGKKCVQKDIFCFCKEIIWPHGADEAVGVPEYCCTDHSTIKWQQPLRFRGKSLQSLSEAENCVGKKHLKCKLRAVPGYSCQIAQNHYQKERDLTLNCAQKDRRQKTKSTWQVKLLLQLMIFQQDAQHHRC